VLPEHKALCAQKSREQARLTLKKAPALPATARR
jgi:hypothetical protein